MDILEIAEHSQGTQVSISNTAAQVTINESGVYELYATCNSRIKIHPTAADDVTAVTGALLLGGNSVYHKIKKGHKLGIIAESASLTGTLEYHWVKEYGAN